MASFAAGRLALVGFAKRRNDVVQRVVVADVLEKRPRLDQVVSSWHDCGHVFSPVSLSLFFLVQIAGALVCFILLVHPLSVYASSSAETSSVAWMITCHDGSSRSHVGRSRRTPAGGSTRC